MYPGPFAATVLQPKTEQGSRHGSQRRLHRVGCGVLHIRQDMGVRVEGDGYGGVAEHLGDYLRVDVFAQKQRGAGVLEVVEAQVFPDAGARLDAFEGAVTQV